MRNFRLKRFIAALCIAAIVGIGAQAMGAVVYKLWLVDSLTGGAATSLDGIHSGNSDIPNNAFAIAMLSGTSVIQFFKYNSGATDTENTSTHPYVIVPDDLPSTGIWTEQSAVSTWYSP